MKKVKLSHKNLFFNSLKRQLPMFYLFLILLLLCMPLSSMLGFYSYEAERMASQTQSGEIALRDIAMALQSVMGIGGLLCAVGFGVFAGCAVMRPLMNRQSAVLFASVPVRREKQALICFGTGAVCYLGALLIATIAAVAVFAFHGHATRLSALFYFLPVQILVFFFFFALTLFSGSLCGMTSIQFLLTAGILIYPYATVGMLVSSIDHIFYEYTDLSYYVSDGTVQILSPLAALVGGGIHSAVSFPESVQIDYPVSYGVAAAVLLVLSLLILRVRRQERAGEPIVFPPVSAVLKYAAMIPCTLAAGVLFYGMDSNNYLFLFLGMVIGGVLSFMLMNVILTKNVRACFHGFKGLLVFGACFSLSFGLIATDPAAFDEYVPEAEDVHSVTMELSNLTVTFTDPDHIQAVGEILGFAQSEDVHGTRFRSVTSQSVSQNTFLNFEYRTYVDVVYQMKGGIPLAKRVYLSDGVSVIEQLDLLYSSRELREAYYEELSANALGAKMTAMVRGEDNYFETRVDFFAQDVKDLVAFMREHDLPLQSDEYGPEIMRIYAGRVSVPIYYASPYDEIYTRYENQGLPIAGDPGEYLSGISFARVYEEGIDGVSTEYRDPEKIKELYLGSTGFNKEYYDMYFERERVLVEFFDRNGYLAAQSVLRQ